MNDLVCVVGSVNTDVTLRVSRLPEGGDTVLASDRLTAQGGKGANQAAAAAALGARVAFVGAVGRDDEAAASRESLAARGIDLTHLAEVDGPSGSAVIAVADDGENLIIVAPGANGALSASHASRAVTALEPRVLLVQLEIPLDVVESAVAAAPPGTTVIVNPAPPLDDPARLAAVLRRADILVPNRGELGRLAGRAEPRSLAEVDACAEQLGFRGQLVVTLGADGAVLHRDGRRIEKLAAADVTPVDASGAGDVFCGALAAGLVSGRTIEDAVRAAVHASGRATEFDGAQVPADFGEQVARPDHVSGSVT